MFALPIPGNCRVRFSAEGGQPALRYDRRGPQSLRLPENWRNRLMPSLLAERVVIELHGVNAWDFRLVAMQQNSPGVFQDLDPDVQAAGVRALQQAEQQVPQDPRTYLIAIDHVHAAGRQGPAAAAAAAPGAQHGDEFADDEPADEEDSDVDSGSYHIYQVDREEEPADDGMAQLVRSLKQLPPGMLQQVLHLAHPELAAQLVPVRAGHPGRSAGVVLPALHVLQHLDVRGRCSWKNAGMLVCVVAFAAGVLPVVAALFSFR